MVGLVQGSADASRRRWAVEKKWSEAEYFIRCKNRSCAVSAAKKTMCWSRRSLGCGSGGGRTESFVPSLSGVRATDVKNVSTFLAWDILSGDKKPDISSNLRLYSLRLGYFTRGDWKSRNGKREDVHYGKPKCTLSTCKRLPGLPSPTRKNASAAPVWFVGKSPCGWNLGVVFWGVSDGLNGEAEAKA